MTVAFIFLLFLLVGTAVPAFKTLLEGNLYLALFWYGSMAALLLFVLPRVGVRRRAPFCERCFYEMPEGESL